MTLPTDGNTTTPWIAVLCATAAAVATAIWSVMLSTEPSIDLLRYASIVAGLISVVSFGVYPLQTTPAILDGVTSGILLVTYQTFIYVSVKTGGPIMQAIINSNVVLIVLYESRNIASSMLSVVIVLSSAVLLLQNQK